MQYIVEIMLFLQYCRFGDIYSNCQPFFFLFQHVAPGMLCTLWVFRFPRQDSTTSTQHVLRLSYSNLHAQIHLPLSPEGVLLKLLFLTRSTDLAFPPLFWILSHSSALYKGGEQTQAAGWIKMVYWLGLLVYSWLLFHIPADIGTAASVPIPQRLRRMGPAYTYHIPLSSSVLQSSVCHAGTLSRGF